MPLKNPPNCGSGVHPPAPSVAIICILPNGKTIRLADQASADTLAAYLQQIASTPVPSGRQRVQK